MKKNKYLIIFARKFWFWYWKKLMNGFAPSDLYGNYKRPQGIKKDTRNSKFNPQNISNLYLLIGSTCPWCHRTLLMYRLKNLSQKINIIFLNPRYQDGEWIFKENFLGMKTLSEIYSKFKLNIKSRPTLPILIRFKNQKIEPISNESSEITRILNKIGNGIDTNRTIIIDESEGLLDFIHNSINDGVYKCGFARNQSAYEKASKNLYSSLNKVDELIKNNGGPWLLGQELSLADIYLFPTLVRWELIYSILFKCTQKDISEYKNIIKWRLNFFNLKEVRETCFEDEWLQDYYTAIFPLNPNQIVPLKNSLEKIIKHN